MSKVYVPDGIITSVTPSLRFGLSLPLVSRHAVSAADFVAQVTAEVQVAERAGFDFCLVPEHHGGPESALTDPLPLLAWLLARTERIAVGTGVLLLPLHSVPRLAEQLSTLQHASGGRVLVGVGTGYQAADFAMFGAVLQQRGAEFERRLTDLRTAWRTGALDGQAVRPALGQQQAPAVLVGAWSPAGIRRAACLADGWIADPIRTDEQITEASARYRAQVTGGGGHVMVIREAWVAETDEAACATFEPAVAPVFRYYLRHGAFAPGDSPAEADLTLSGALARRVVCGSAPTVVDRLCELVDATGADSVALALRHPGGPSHSEVLEAIERFGRDVFPQVRHRAVMTRGGVA